MKKQISLFDYADDKELKRRFSRVAHGGDLNLNKRKLDRPLSTRRPIHIVLRSGQARGNWSFLSFKNRIEVERIIKKQARKFAIKLQDYANVGNHLHLKVKAGGREAFKSFLRSITCMLARFITKARRGFKLKKRFWDGLAFTRVLKSYREEIHLRGYLIANRQEASRGPAARERFLNKFREWVRVTYAAKVAGNSA